MSDAPPLIQRLLKRWPAKNPPHPIQPLLDHGSLEALYQPIIGLQSGAIDGHEALVRVPKDGASESPQALLDTAQAALLHTELELACVKRALEGWGYPHTAGRVYLSLSADTLIALSEPHALQRLEGLFLKSQVPYKRAVVEITQHRKLKDLAALERTTTALQALGCAIALDDVKASQRSLDLWLRLKPSIVKLDSRMSADLQQDPAKAKVLRTLANLGFKTGANLVAKAVDDAADLRIVRDAGIQMAQGNFLGFPSPAVVDTLNLRARNVLAEKWSMQDPNSQAGELVSVDSGLQGLRRGQQWWD